MGGWTQVDESTLQRQSASAWTPVQEFIMVGPKGEKVNVKPAEVPAMRQKSYALTADNPDVLKILKQNGETAYALPSEAEGFIKSGGTIVSDDEIATMKNPDATPEQKAEARAKMFEHQRINMTHSPYVKQQITDKAIGSAVLAAPVAASAFAPTAVAVPGGAGFGGAAASTAAGPSAVGAVAGAVVKKTVPYLVKGAAGYLGWQGVKGLFKDML